MLPTDFAFNQQNLQDFEDCYRRFHLRYVEHLEWPAIESEPVLIQERLMELGQTFHTMVQQSLSGVPADVIRAGIHDEQLERWWRNFESFDLDLSNKTFLVEELISVPLADFRLVAKFDLFTIDEKHNILIYDWKTSQKPPIRKNLLAKTQSKVYPFVAVRSSAALTHSDPVGPEKVKMIYWFPEFPEDAVELDYSASQYEKAGQSFTDTINEINTLEGREAFPKTEDRKRCAYCAFRSFCGRGDTPGSNDEDALPISSASDEAFDINFDSF